MSSSSATAVVAANLPPVPNGTLYAVVVGIQQFKNPAYKLNYSVSDAQLFSDTLKRYSAPLFKRIDVKLLTTPAETTRDSLIRALEGMQSMVGPEDQFVFYMASHGIAKDGVFFLLTSNVSSVETDRLTADAVSSQELTGLLASIPVAKKLVIIDTCHAQALGTALQAAILSQGMSTQTAATLLSRGLGLTVLSATTTDQEALEGYKDHGLFTYVVSDGLAGTLAAAINGCMASVRPGGLTVAFGV